MYRELYLLTYNMNITVKHIERHNTTSQLVQTPLTITHARKKCNKNVKDCERNSLNINLSQKNNLCLLRNFNTFTGTTTFTRLLFRNQERIQKVEKVICRLYRSLFILNTIENLRKNIGNIIFL